MTNISDARAILETIPAGLKGVRSESKAIAKLEDALDKVTYALELTLKEIDSLQKEYKDEANCLGDHLLDHERWEPSKEDWLNYLKTRREERKAEVQGIGESLGEHMGDDEA